MEISEVNSLDKTSRQRVSVERERSLAPRRRPGRLGQLWLIIVFAAIIVVAAVMIGKGNNQPQQSESNIREKARQVASLFAGIPQHGTVLGKRNAPVTLTEFVDLQCSACGAYTDRVLPELISRYVRAGKLRVDLRLWVLRDHANMSLYPTQIAFAAQQQGQLWQFVDLFYNFQRPEAASSSFIARLLDAMPELDADRVFADANRAAVVEQINRVDYEAEQLGVTGTPSFLISRRNGIPRPLGNEEELLDKSELFSAIETELKKTPR